MLPSELPQVDETQGYQRLFDACKEMLCIASFDGRVVRANLAFARAFGYGTDTLSGRSITDLVEPEDRPAAHSVLARAARGNSTQEFESRCCRRDGSSLALSWSATPEPGDGLLYVSARDITDDKHEKDELLRNKELLEAITHTHSLHIAGHEPRELFDSLLSRLLAFTGSEFGFIGEVYQDSDERPYLKTHAITNVAWNEETQRFYEENAPVGLEFRNLDTLFGHVLTTGEPVISNDPQKDARSHGTPPGHPPLKSFLGLPLFVGEKMLGMVGVANRSNGYETATVQLLEPLLSYCGQLINTFQIDSRRAAIQDELCEREARIEGILYAAADAIISIDHQGHIITFNPAAESMFGYTAEQAIGQNVSMLMPAPYSQEHDRYLSEYLRTGVQRVLGVGREASGQRSDGTTFPIELSVSEVKRSGTTTFTGIVRDISERKRAERELARVNAQLAGVLDAATQVSVIATDINGLITVFNSGAENMLGYRSDEMVGKKTPEIIHLEEEVVRRSKELSEELGREVTGFEVFVAYAKDDRHERREWTYVRKDGQHLTVNLVVTAVKNSNGEITGFLGVAEDIGARKRSEQALRQSEERFELAVAGSNDGLWDWDIQSNAVYFSPRLKELLGYSIDEMEGSYQAWESLLHNEDKQRVLGALSDHVERRVPYDIEYRLLCKSQAYRWFRARGQAVWNDRGQATRMAGSLTDITERKEFEIELQSAKDALFDSEQQYRAIIEATPECVKLLDKDGVLLDMNSVGLSYIEANSLEEVQGECVYPIVADEYRDQFRTLNEDVCNGHRRTLQFEIVGLAGTRRFMETSAVPLTTQDGETVQLSITREITERKRQDAALRAAKEAAETASRAKSEFLANMSHEIRTPMNGIIGMTDLVLDTEMADEQREYIQIVKDSANSLLAVINDILDFSKIEAGKLDLEREAFPLRRTVDKTLRALDVRAQQKKLNFSWRIDESIPDHLIGDSHRLRQILVNLTGNAIKFTTDGAVWLRADRKSVARGEIEVHFQVSDTGIGIAENEVSKIFESFTQADSSTTRTFGGTGLGLAICSQLVGLMGGRIWVESEPGRGSTFHFTARFAINSAAATDSETEPATPSPSQESLNILLAEDHAVNQRYASRLLEKQGHSVILAENGIEAVQLYKSETVDLILMDIQMPRMDGFEATARIRAHECDTMRHTPIIAMTAHAMKGDRERCLDHGMDGYISKPVAQIQLLAEIARVLPSDDSENAEVRGRSVEVSSDSVFNYEDARRQVDGDEELLRELITLHLSELPKVVAAISNGLRSADCKAVQNGAHRLKGALGLMCAKRASDAARRLEKHAESENAAECETLLAKLESELNELSVALTAVLDSEIDTPAVGENA